MRVQRTIQVERPMPAVVAYLADFGNTVHWDPGTISCTRIDHGPVKLGSTWLNVSEFNDRVVELEYSLRRHEPARLTFVGAGSRATTADDLRFEASGRTTTIVYQAEIRFNGLLRLAVPFLHKRFEALADDVAESMTRELSKL